MKVKRVCSVCGKKYSYCINADKGESWRNAWCSENCRNLFKAMSAYSIGNLSKDELETVLLENGFDEDSQYTDKIKARLDEIFHWSEITGTSLEDIASVGETASEHNAASVEEAVLEEDAASADEVVQEKDLVFVEDTTLEETEQEQPQSE